jgi:hypothetical protein
MAKSAEGELLPGASIRCGNLSSNTGSTGTVVAQSPCVRERDLPDENCIIAFIRVCTRFRDFGQTFRLHVVLAF